jgi:hypothetical protein
MIQPMTALPALDYERLRPSWRPTGAAILVGLVVLALGLTVALGELKAMAVRGSIVDGFPIGSPVACGLQAEPCSVYVALALAALDAREPGHPGMVSATPYVEDMSNPKIFDQTVMYTRSGSVIAVVFRLADGSTRAAGAACVGVAPCFGVATYPH